MRQKLVKSEVKMKQKLLESGAKISLFESDLGLSATKMTLTTSAFFRHIQFIGLGDWVKA